MPNLCTNRIEVQGSAEELAALAAALRSGEAGADLLRLIPAEDLPYELDNLVEGGAVIFDSAWSPATEISEELSQRFPGLTFRHEFDEPGSDYSGYQVYQGGVMVESGRGEYGAYPIDGEEETFGTSYGEEEADEED